MAAIFKEEKIKRIKYIKENYQNKTLKEMAIDQKVNIDCIAQWMKAMGLKKYKTQSNERIKSI
jgi:hypothetical protein